MSVAKDEHSALFRPLTIGNFTVANRLVLAPLTRYRASDAHVPLPFVKDYYAQRGCVPGTLLITEATFISPRGSGYKNVPGIWNADQIAAWKEVTDAVHAKGSFIFCQLWALGRAATPEVLKREGNGELVFGSSSANAIPGKEELGTPKELSEKEIMTFIGEYAQAAKNAIAAGFDGVEIHGANGYLVDQFIQDVVNMRTDAWGGSIEKRARFVLEVASACVSAVGAEKVGIRLSPWSSFQGMRMKQPLPQFIHVVEGLKALGIAYVHLVESRVSGSSDVEQKGTEEDVWATKKNDELIELWAEGGNTRPVLLAGAFKPDTARRCVDEQYPGKNVAIVFGRYFISNPDLVFRVQQNIPLRDYNRETFYTAKATEGYTDYEFSKDFRGIQACDS